MQSLHVRIFGIVQGVGFRPFVHRLALEHSILGTVANKGSLVEVFAQGTRANLKSFLKDICDRAPERSLIMKMTQEPCDLPVLDSFAIIDSTREDGPIFVSPDIATCPLCEQELFDPKDRRYLHPFINCTACGPRLSILDSMPYDRERTSMKSFPMCPDCAFEYTEPSTRRYDAQPVCCPKCGPTLTLMDPLGKKLALGDAVIQKTREALASGRIVAIKGIGGFHLACDATSDAAVLLLRERKRRPTKPFAVMVRDLAMAERCAFVDKESSALLTGWQRPILLLSQKKGSGLSEHLAPGNPRIGLFLPYTPLHHLLFAYPDGREMPQALVMTSGNVSGAPICHTDELVLRELNGVCDAILTHDRPITVRCDDSVVLEHEGSHSMIRRSRGYAPLPIVLSKNYTGAVLGIGGELKNTFCLARNELLYLSPHVGDLSDIRTFAALKETLKRLTSLLEITPSHVACDPHPLYASKALAQELGLPVIPVQHHHAHILSCMAENDVFQPVIGIAFDGTGYGSDGTIWGGEILLASLSGFTRFASIQPFPHAGGDAASREGWRIAVSLLTMAKPLDAQDMAERLNLADSQAISAQSVITRRGINTVQSTSAGRLFDALAALLGLCRASTFEGEAACALEFSAEQAKSAYPLALSSLPFSCTPLPNKDRGPHAPRYYMPTTELIIALAQERLAGACAGELARTFHTALAAMVLECALLARKESGLNHVALSGGVFQNSLFLSLCVRALTDEHFTVLTHTNVPANDGGLSLGQALFALQAISTGSAPH